MKVVTAIFGTALVTVATIATAIPFDVRTAQSNANLSPFAQCIRQKYPNYPGVNNVDRKAVHECLNPQQPPALARREIANTSAADGPAENELIYEPQELQAREFVDNVMAAGKKLFLEQNPHCNIPEVPNNFLFVKEIMAKTEEWCERIKVDMEVYGVAENGGTGLFAALLPFGHDKRGHQLKDKVEVGLQLAITLAPPSVGQTLETTKAIARGVYDLCNDGIERILTKGSGCTQEIKYYRPSKAKHYTDDAARSGQVALFWGDTDTTIGKLVLDVFN